MRLPTPTLPADGRLFLVQFRTLGLPEWREVDDFDMTWHVQRRTLAAPGSDAQLDELVAALKTEADLWASAWKQAMDEQNRRLYLRTYHDDPARLLARVLEAAALATATGAELVRSRDAIETTRGIRRSSSSC